MSLAGIFKPKIENQLRGQKAQRFGLAFEKVFESHCHRMGITTTRMPDGCRVVGGGRLLRVQTPWDWILSHQGKSAFVDTKTIDAKSFPRSHIEMHQVSPMYQHELAGAIAGYVIWLRVNDSVIFLPAGELLNIMRVRGASVNGQHPGAINLGCVDGLGGLDVLRLFRGNSAIEKMVESETKKDENDANES